MNEMDKIFLADAVFEKRTLAGLRWLKRSIDITKSGGSSAYYSGIYKPFKGWQIAYPETTGYIIKTFFDYHSLYKDEALYNYALKSADWICSLQLETGALPGGFVNSTTPSVFNTGQMLIGITAAYEHTRSDAYFTVMKRAVAWLLSILEDDGSWQSGAYVKGWIPSYYTRVIWPVLWANTHLKEESTVQLMKKSLTYYKNKITPKYAVKDWAFKKDQKAFTHTIAYTIRGFLESAVLLNDDELLDISVKLGEKIMRLRELNGKLAGWYNENWKGGYWFTCLTGNAQLSVILTRMYQITGDIRYLNTSLKIFDDIVKKQKLSANKNIHGALPGSSPFWGRYLIFRYPNWATKFYLDAYYLLKQEVDKMESEQVKKTAGR